MTPQMTNIAKHILKEEMFRDYCQLHAQESKYGFPSDCIKTHKHLQTMINHRQSFKEDQYGIAGTIPCIEGSKFLSSHTKII